MRKTKRCLRLLLLIVVIAGVIRGGMARGIVSRPQGDAAESEAAEYPDIPVMEELSAAEPEETEKINFEDACAGSYAYDCLSDSEKIWYRDINEIIAAMDENAALSAEGLQAGLDETDADHIFQCVLLDHPEYFYVEGYYYTKYTRLDKVVKVDFSGNYTMSAEEAAERLEQIEASASAILSGIDPGAEDYDKMLYIYETLIRQTDYDLQAPDNQNIYSVFVGKSSVCQGYAKATQYLLNKLGIENTLVTGYVENGDGHSWNMVKLDGEYYYVDTTWGDASYFPLGQQQPQTVPEINYDYLCVTTKQLEKTHIIDNEVPVPECVAVADNYYVRSGCLFTGYDEEQLLRVFDTAGEDGREVISLKCQDEATYQEMLEQLIDHMEIFRFMSLEEGTVCYSQNENQLSMSFWVTNE